MRTKPPNRRSENLETRHQDISGIPACHRCAYVQPERLQLPRDGPTRLHAAGLGGAKGLFYRACAYVGGV